MAYNLMDYSPGVLEHYEHPRNAGDLPDADAVATVENPACGDTMRLALRIEAGRVTEARFRTYGCAAAIAASSVTTELLVGRTLEEARAITGREVAEALGGLPPRKLHCSVLAKDAIRAVMDSYRRGEEEAGRQSGKKH
ncbi:MAG TPA: iron-sulfur cluster assembly scaffold protein [Candidatus Saccharimonadales bacterium]|nr:iron-sulfur cluster assembly scaffold protein [Candidatus Saccharimonadales bacterium]